MTKAGTLSCAATRGHHTAAVILRFLHRCNIDIFTVFRSHNILLGEGIPCPQTTILHVPSCKGGVGDLLVHGRNAGCVMCDV